MMKWSRVVKSTSYLLGLMMVILITDCRKKDLRNLNYRTGPKHCYNNIKDGDEKIIDGGGSCSCNKKYKPRSGCGVLPNTVVIGSGDYRVTSVNRETVSFNALELRINLSNTDLILVTCRPDVSLNVPLSSREIKIELFSAAYGYNRLNAEDFVIASDGCMAYLSSCNFTFTPSGSAAVTGRIFADIKLFN